MTVSSPARWRDFDYVGVDLSDVVGTPGLPEPTAFASAVSSGFKAEWRQLTPSTEAQFLVGEPVGLAPGAAGDKLSSFLTRVEESIPTSNLGAGTCEVLQETESACGNHISAQQLVRNTQVLGARFKIHLDGDKAYAVTGRPVGNIDALDPGEPPATSGAEVADAVRSHFNLPSDIRVEIVRPIIIPVDGRGFWALETRFLVYEPPSDVRAFVLSRDLSVALSFNTASAAFHGEAQIYPINPLRTPTLQVGRLDYIGPTPADGLSGAVVEVRPLLGQAITAPSRDFRNVAEPGSDEVQTYHHLCAGLKFFRSLFDNAIFTQPPFAPIRAIVHDPRAPFNSYFMPSTGNLLFGDFGDKPSARSGDVIIHELGHAVVNRVSRLGKGPQNPQGRGLSEGYCDYFAASALDDPIIADYVAGEQAGMRDCARPGLRFPAAFAGVDEHVTGEVWASVLWSIRENCGPGIADTLAAESLQFLDSMSTFEHGHAALLTADREVFPGTGGLGRHADIINAEFEARTPL